MFYQNKEQIKDLATTKLLWRGRRSGGTKGDEIEMFAIPEVVHNLQDTNDYQHDGGHGDQQGDDYDDDGRAGTWETQKEAFKRVITMGEREMRTEAHQTNI